MQIMRLLQILLLQTYSNFILQNLCPNLERRSCFYYIVLGSYNNARYNISIPFGKYAKKRKDININKSKSW